MYIYACNIDFDHTKDEDIFYIVRILQIILKSGENHVAIVAPSAQAAFLSKLTTGRPFNNQKPFKIRPHKY